MNTAVGASQLHCTMRTHAMDDFRDRSSICRYIDCKTLVNTVETIKVIGLRI